MSLIRRASPSHDGSRVVATRNADQAIAIAHARRGTALTTDYLAAAWRSADIKIDTMTIASNMYPSTGRNAVMSLTAWASNFHRSGANTRYVATPAPKIWKRPRARTKNGIA